MRTAAICPTCAVYENALCIIYNGPYLNNIDVNPLEDLETILGKINTKLVPKTGTTAPTSTTTTFTKHTGGRGVHKCWELLSDETGQHLVSQSKCRSCRMVVKHHKKSEKVKAHLNSCSEFRRSMADLP